MGGVRELHGFPAELAPELYVLGNPHFLSYLIREDPWILIEAGASCVVPELLEQMRALGITPDREGRIVILHAHYDHVCAVPFLLDAYPHAKVIASAVAKKVLGKQKVMEGFAVNDRYTTEVLSGQGMFSASPPEPRARTVEVDIVSDNLGPVSLSRGKLEFYPAQGHSPCGIAAYLPAENILFPSDALGFNIGGEEFFPLFFHSYREYLSTIDRFVQLKPRVLAFPHEVVYEGPEFIAGFMSRVRGEAVELKDFIRARSKQGAEPVAEVLFDRYYRDNLLFYSPENIRLCVDLLIKRALEAEN